MTPDSRHATVMTIGALSRRTGVPVKALREYEDLGLIYTAGRSSGNYRLFDEEALWCVGVIATLTGLGMTLAEIGDLAASYLQRSGEPISPRLANLASHGHPTATVPMGGPPGLVGGRGLA
jgi:MerR family copper efflux transcriptional regulator